MIRPPFAARVVTGLIVTAIEETRKLPSTAVTLPMTAVSQTLQAGMRFQQGIAELAIKGDEVLDAIFHRAQEEPEWATFDDDAPADVTHDPKSPENTPGAEPATASVTPITAAPTAAANATPGHLPTGPDEPTPADMPSEQADTVEPTPPAPAAKASATGTAAKKATRSAAKKAPAKKAAPKRAAPTADDDDAPSTGDGSAPANTGRFALYSSAPDNVVRSDVEATPVAPSPDAPEIVEFLDYDGLTLAQLRSKIRTVDLDDLRALADYERSHRGRAPFQTMLDNRITAAAGK